MAKVIVYHSYYRCDTGCCGHVVELQDDNGNRTDHEFDFDHPWGEDARAFAEKLIRDKFGDEHVADLDWQNCSVVNC